ncbi:MAG: DUF4215 domain-containing protein [Myxococcota bacterium]
MKGWVVRGAAGLGFLLGLGAASGGCDTEDSYRCGSDMECRRSDGRGSLGTCEPTGFCAFPDVTCVSNRRYGTAAPRTIAGLCVPPDTVPNDDEDVSKVEAVCGDGIVGGDEPCDGADLGGRTCASQGFASGALACTGDCTLDTSFCNMCGNGSLDAGEECDGDALGGQTTCADVGLGEVDEALGCTDTCTLSYVECSACGNGSIDGPEDCDRSGPNLNGATCESEGFDAGTLGCTQGCTFDTTSCEQCGNAVKEGTEQCDAADLDGLSCEALGYEGGALGCDDSCALDESGCSSCNDGIVSGTEACDPSVLALVSCESLGMGFDSGAASCDECMPDTSACGTCGNGALDGEENCDQLDLGGASCESLGFASGTLACSTLCGFDTSGCNGAGCNDDIVNTPDEECDGVDLANETCESLGFDGGTLSCNGGCTFDTSNCTECGNDITEPGEDCDDGNSVNDDQCSNACTWNTTPLDVTVGGNTTIDATIEATCVLTGETCALDGMGDTAVWDQMEDPGCTVQCPQGSGVQVTCTDGGQANREFESMLLVGYGPSNCPSDEMCTTTYTIQTAPLSVICSYTD